MTALLVNDEPVDLFSFLVEFIRLLSGRRNAKPFVEHYSSPYYGLK